MRLSWLRNSMAPMQKLRISSPLMSTLPESTTASAGFCSDRTLGPLPTPFSAGHDAIVVTSMILDPSITTSGASPSSSRRSPRRMPSITAGPTICGSNDVGRITHSPCALPVG
jgi:hypothetical protein